MSEMKVLGPEDPSKPRRNWHLVTEFLRKHEGEWVEVDKDVPASLANWVNGRNGPKPLAIREDAEFDYQARALDKGKSGRCRLVIKATRKDNA